MNREWTSSWTKAEHEEAYGIKISDVRWEEIAGALDDAVMNTLEEYSRAD